MGVKECASSNVFGWYGPQGGDGQAVISRAEQQAQVIAATVELLASLSRR